VLDGKVEPVEVSFKIPDVEVKILNVVGMAYHVPLAMNTLKDAVDVELLVTFAPTDFVCRALPDAV
jgi:hypothetical protein